MTEESGWILRPLLGIQKSEITQYLDSNRLKYKIDSTNKDTDITRNYLRHEIIPKFEKVNTSYKQNISKTLDYFEDLKNFIDIEVKKFLSPPPSPLPSKEGEKERSFNIEGFHSLSPFLQKEVIRYIYYTSNDKSTIWLSEANITEVIKFINWKNNKTIKEIRNMKMEKDNKIIKY
jgi:tRNA(Ile)-lysidine synthase TilS/MesJ